MAAEMPAVLGRSQASQPLAKKKKNMAQWNPYKAHRSVGLVNVRVTLRDL